MLENPYIRFAAGNAGLLTSLVIWAVVVFVPAIVLWWFALQKRAVIKVAVVVFVICASIQILVRLAFKRFSSVIQRIKELGLL